MSVWGAWPVSEAAPGENGGSVLAGDNLSFLDPFSLCPPGPAATVLLPFKTTVAIITFLLSLYFCLVPESMCAKYAHVYVNSWVTGRPLSTSKGPGKQCRVTSDGRPFGPNVLWPVY